MWPRYPPQDPAESLQLSTPEGATLVKGVLDGGVTTGMEETRKEEAQKRGHPKQERFLKSPSQPTKKGKPGWLLQIPWQLK